MYNHVQVVKEYLAQKLQEQNVGMIYIKNRLPKDPKEFNTLFAYNGSIQAWIVSRIGIGRSTKDSNFIRVPDRYRITTFYGFNDATDAETVFETTITKIYVMLVQDETLGGTVDIVEGISVPDISLVKIGGILSYYTEFTLETQVFYGM